MNMLQRRIIGLTVMMLALGGCGEPATPAPAPTPTVSGPPYTLEQADPAAAQSGACADVHPPPAASYYQDPDKTPVPQTTEAVYKPTINITRTEYEQALKRWQTAGVRDYDMDIDDVSMGGEEWLVYARDGIVTINEPHNEYIYKPPCLHLLPARLASTSRPTVSGVCSKWSIRFSPLGCVRCAGNGPSR